MTHPDPDPRSRSRANDARPRRAVALKHTLDSPAAPRVTATGAGEVADRILELAREHGVPVRRDADLLELLSVSEVGDEIPTEVYASVARLIAFLWGMNEELAAGIEGSVEGEQAA